MIEPVLARVREGVRYWRQTGQAPPEIAAVEPAAAALATAPAAATAPTAPAAPAAQALRAPDGRETLASLEVDLGPGQPLDPSTAARMSGALGADVGHARIHSGPVAARKAADAGSVAFAVGPNVVLGAGAPAAGTLDGDALLAHELATPSSSAAPPAPSRRAGSPSPTSRRRPRSKPTPSQPAPSPSSTARPGPVCSPAWAARQRAWSGGSPTRSRPN